MIRTASLALYALGLVLSCGVSAHVDLRADSTPRYHHDRRAGNTDFDWDSIEPSPTLEYHDCLDGFQCARLELPLDWNSTSKNESDARKIAVAILKLPAVVPESDPAFGGSIFVNPGGPGGSGVQYLYRAGQILRETVEKPGERHYDFISFDPRGVGFTTPAADCYGGNNLARVAKAVEFAGTGGLSTASRLSLAYNYALVEGESRRCKAAAEEEILSIFEYVSTANVARDMVEMLDQIKALREKDGCGGKHGNSTCTDSHGEERLQYIGISYGTALGNTFASMYPGRVHRMLLDAVVDADDYSKGTGWLNGIEDADALFDEFLKGCYETGTSVCKLARANDSSWEDISTRVWDTFRDLDKMPVGVPDPNGYVSVLTGWELRSATANTIFRPNMFQAVAQLLNYAVEGQYQKAIEMLSNLGRLNNLEVARKQDPTERNLTMTSSVTYNSQSAIVCSDGDDVSGKGLDFWADYIDTLTSKSKLLGDSYAPFRFNCAHWPFKANWSFKGPFTTPEHDPSQIAGRPSAPLLFLSPRYDPVTSLRSARRVASKHPGSRVVVQESLGHGVISNGASDCTKKIIADYFDSGELPEGPREMSCERLQDPWGVK